MSLYKYGISDKTIGAMQNSDPEVQQMLENAQQNNQTQPPASNGIMDIIKELFGYGDAGASDLGEIANLQSILNPITPEMGANLRYRSDPSAENGRYILSRIGSPNITYPQNYAQRYGPYVDFNLDPEVNMGATGTVPKLKEGILSQVDSRFPLYDDFTVAEQGDDLEENAVTVDELGNLKQPSGIAKLFEFLGNIPTPFNLIRRGLGSLKGLNDRIQGSDFGQSRTGAEYFMKRRERKQAERAQQAMPDVYRSARDQGFTNDRGGFSTSAADKAGTSAGSGEFNPSTSRGRSGF